MKRQTFLRASALGLLALAAGERSFAAASHASHRLGGAWRRALTSATSATTAQDFVGILTLDWEQQKVRVQTEHAVPSRAHGVLSEASGGFIVVAARPGTWLRRLDADGQVAQHVDISLGKTGRTLDGHIIASADGKLLYTPETNQTTGEGWLSVRDAKTLAIQEEWRTHGCDPHQLVLDSSGAIMLANGGIQRSADGKKINLEDMNSSLVRLDGQTGELLGKWRLNDHRLSMRHMVWNQVNSDTDNSSTQSLLGIAIQAEHDDIAQRRSAPALALWDGEKLNVPSRDTAAGGYAGDIAPGPGGGFVLSGQRMGKGVLWHPDAPEQLFPIAELKEVCALVAPQRQPVSQLVKNELNGVLMGSERGVAHWHPKEKPRMLPWPTTMSLDNHWVMLENA